VYRGPKLLISFLIGDLMPSLLKRGRGGVAWYDARVPLKPVSWLVGRRLTEMACISYENHGRRNDFYDRGETESNRQSMLTEAYRVITAILPCAQCS